MQVRRWPLRPCSGWRGNAGAKVDNGKLLVSQGVGCVLSETESNHGYVTVDSEKILDVLDNEDLLKKYSLKESVKIANQAVREANELPDIKPTAEVFLHALLPFKYTLHLHPVIINALLINRDAQKSYQTYTRMPVLSGMPPGWKCPFFSPSTCKASQRSRISTL